MKMVTHWFWAAFIEHRTIYYRVFLAATLINLLSASSAIFIMVVYDRVVPNSAFESLYALTIGMAIVILFDFLLKILRSYFIDYAGEYVDKKIGNSIFDRLLDAPTNVVTGPVGATANTFKEFDMVREFFTSATLSLVVDLPFIFLFIFIIYLLSGSLAVVPLLAVPLVLLVGFLIQPFLSKVSKEIGSRNQEKQSILVETISGIESIKVLGGGDFLRNRWAKAATKQAEASRVSRSLGQIVINTAQSAQQICLVGIVFYGVFLVHEGVLSMGAMVAAVLLSSRTLAPLAQIANLFGRANGAKNAYLRLSKFMEDTETKDLKGLVGRSNLGTLEFNSCCFRYPDKELDTLNKVNFKIHEGEKVGLLGRNGSGKSTLVKLACGLLYPTEGMATYDGVSIKQINSKDLAKSLGIVLQDVQLFSGSVRENIIMGRDNISDEDIVSAGKLSGLDDFIGKMPGGYDFQLLDRGKGLSGGQRQAIAISRGMVHKPTHLILDEPTSSMDLNAEKDFITKLSQTIGKSTVLLVSHRIPLLKILDRIIIIHEGMIVDDGPTDEILDKLNS